MMEFVDNLSNWYVRRSRRRFWKSENDGDKKEAYQTLYIVLKEFSKLLAPFTPFLADEIYRNLGQSEESVHLCDWPKANKKLIKLELNEEMAIIRKIVNLGHNVRSKTGIKVRQPLAKVQIGLPEKVDPLIVIAQADVICEELNVKKLEILKEVADVVTKVIKPDARKLGPKYGKDVQNIIQKVKAGEFTDLDEGKIKVDDFVLEPDEFEVGYEGKAGLDAQGESGYVVILDSTITEELKHEGYAREIIRTIQEMRKKAGFSVSDRIYLQIKSEGVLETAVTSFADYIKHETLCIELQQGSEFEWTLDEEIEIDGMKAKLGVRKGEE